MKNVEKNAKRRTPAPKGTLKRVLYYVGRYPLPLIGALVFAVLTVAGSLLVPVFLGDAIDCIIENGVRWRALKLLFVKTGFATAISAVSQWLLSLCNNSLSCNVVRDIRKDAFCKLGS